MNVLEAYFFLFLIFLVFYYFYNRRHFFERLLFRDSSKEKKEPWKPVCPRCGSLNVKSKYIVSPIEISMQGAKKLQERVQVIGRMMPFLIGWQPENPSVYICMDCDYFGICLEVEEFQIEKVRKRIKKFSE